MTRRRRGVWALRGLLLVAALLHLWGCFGQGLPYAFFPDEENNIERALAMGARRSLDPQWFTKPALGYYLLLAEYGAYYGVGRVAGWFESPNDFAEHYFEDPTNFFVLGRVMIALFGVFGVFLTYRLGGALGGRGTGLLAAAGLALSPGYVGSAQQVKMDIPCAVLTLWACLAALSLQRKGRWRDYGAAGLLAGLAMATKYYAAAFLLVFFLSHVLRGARARQLDARVWTSKRFFFGLGLFFGGFFIGSPYNFLSPTWFRTWLLPTLQWVGSRLGLLAGHTLEAGGGDPNHLSVLESLSILFGNLFSADGMGPVLTVGALVGLSLMVARRRSGNGLVAFTLLFFMMFVAVAGRQRSPEARHLAMVYPFVAVAAAVGLLGVARAIPWLHRRWSRTRWAGLAALLLAIPVPGLPGGGVLLMTRARSASDPRLEAIAWIEEQIPPGTCLLNNAPWRLRPNSARTHWIPAYAEKLVSSGAVRAEDLTVHLTRSSFEGLAVGRQRAPSWDVILFHGAWQTEGLRERRHAAAGYNPLWPRSPWGDLLPMVLADAEKRGELEALSGAAAKTLFLAKVRALAPGEAELAPVEFWTRPTVVSVRWLTGTKDSGFRVPEYLISTKVTYDNYRKKSKRENFPDFAAFFDDLEAHYLCFEFNGKDPRPERVVRIWDLRQRLQRGKVVSVGTR